MRSSHLLQPCVFLLCLITASASKPAEWSQSTFAEFMEGDFDGVSVSTEGRLSLAPSLTRLMETEQSLIHSLVVDKSGNAFVGTGNEGKIFRIPPDDSGSQFAQLDEKGVFGLVVDSSNRLYAAGGPEGKVYRVQQNGEVEEFFDPEEKYIWALTIDSSDNLYVATGPKGIVYRVNKQGDGTVFLDSKDTHIVSLAWDLDGNLLAGSASEGILYSVNRDGRVSVLFDSDLTEVKAITTDRYGNIYAAVLASGAGTPAQDAETSSGSSSSKSPQTDSSVESKLTVEGTAPGRKLEILKVARDRMLETLYTSDKHLAYDLAVQSDGSLLVATGDKGRIISITANRMLRLLAQSTDEQVTKLVSNSGNLLVATSNLGNLYRLEPNPAEKGVYTSKVLDAGMFSDWGRVRWALSNVTSGAPVVSTRSGNTKSPDETWSDWSGKYESSSGSRIDSPSGRYLQWRAEFASTGSGSLTVEANSLEAVEISYLQRNVAPLVKELTVHAPGSAYMKTPTSPPPGGGNLGGPSQAHLLSLPAKIRSLEKEVSVPPRMVFVPGARSFSWEAEDPNGDDLVYDLSYRLEGDREWKLLVKGHEDTFFTLDGASFPDGRYHFKVEASDRLSNPPPLALAGSLASREFTISNRLPSIEGLETRVAGGALKVSFRASSSASDIFQAEYSLNGEDWWIAYPTDGISDSSAEEYEISIPELKSGEVVVWVRVVDSVGSLVTERATATIP